MLLLLLLLQLQLLLPPLLLLVVLLPVPHLLFITKLQLQRWLLLPLLLLVSRSLYIQTFEQATSLCTLWTNLVSHSLPRTQNRSPKRDMVPLSIAYRPSFTSMVLLMLQLIPIGAQASKAPLLKS